MAIHCHGGGACQGSDPCCYASREKAGAGRGLYLHGGDGGAAGRETVVQYYFGLRIIGYANAYAGNYMVDSKKTPGDKVLMAPLDANLAPADEAPRFASSRVCSPPVALEALRDKDIMTKYSAILMVIYGPTGVPAG